MTALLENAVTLADVAKATGSPPADVEAECRALRLFIGHDWAGRPAVDVQDAAVLVDGSARRDADHQVAWRAHQDATEAWERDRAQVAAKARSEAYTAAVRQGKGDPASAGEAREAVREAVEEFERTHPAPEFLSSGPSTRNWFAKIKEAVR